MSDPKFRSWPITETAALEPMLRDMGLRVPAEDIDGTAPGRVAACLSDALVSVGPAGRGGTGSFISADGLIITNHHVALDAVRQASGVDHDHLKDGFVARSRADELSGKDYEVWITRSCVDVSEQLAASRTCADPLQRSNLVRDRRQDIARAAEADAAKADATVPPSHNTTPDPSGNTPPDSSASAAPPRRPPSSLRCEVQEMWPDRTYVLFTYERLRDVRIVYVPPMAIGCFGGDTDNFE